MSAGAIIIVNKAKLYLFDATALLSVTTNWKLVLLTSSFSPADTTDGVYADLANELTTSGGYTAGGIALANVALTRSTGTIKFTCDAAVWTASGGGIPAWRYGYIYNNATINSIVKPILGHFLGDSTPADVPATTSGNTLTVTPNASGLVSAT